MMEIRHRKDVGKGANSEKEYTWKRGEKRMIEGRGRRR